jgi:hypothetical protein
MVVRSPASAPRHRSKTKKWVRRIVVPKGRGERTQADVIAYLRRFVVGAEEYLNDWLTRKKLG